MTDTIAACSESALGANIDTTRNGVKAELGWRLSTMTEVPVDWLRDLICSPPGPITLPAQLEGITSLNVSIPVVVLLLLLLVEAVL